MTSAQHGGYSYGRHRNVQPLHSASWPAGHPCAFVSPTRGHVGRRARRALVGSSAQRAEGRPPEAAARSSGDGQYEISAARLPGFT